MEGLGKEGIDLSGAVDMLKEMLADDEGKQRLQGIMNMLGGTAEQNTPGAATGGIDADSIETIMKLQRAATIASNRALNNKSGLLTALKPFLKPARQEKVDNAVKLIKLGGVIEAMREMQGE